MIVYTGGTFDVFHAGHAEFLRRCKEIAGPDGEVIVGLNTDEFVAEYKGRPPAVPYHEREAILRACRYVDDVIANFGGADSRPAVLAAGADLVVIGSDWHARDYLAQMQFTWEWLHQHNIALVYVPRVTPISSTIVKARVAEGR